MLTFPEARPARGWNCGTGRRGYNIVDDFVDLLLFRKGSDSGIVFPRCSAQGWLEDPRTNHKRGGLVPECRSQSVSRGLEVAVVLLIRGLDLEGGASGATLGLYIKAPETTMLGAIADCARSHQMACCTPAGRVEVLPYGSLGQWHEVVNLVN